MADLDLTAAIAKAVTYIAGSDAQTLAQTAVTAAAPLIEAAVRERLGREIRDFAKEAAKTDDPSAILGLICAAAMVEGKAKGSIDELADELDDLIGNAPVESAPAAKTPSCDEPVWDGPYKMRCGRLMPKGECMRHGKPSGGAASPATSDTTDEGKTK